MQHFHTNSSNREDVRNQTCHNQGGIFNISQFEIVKTNLPNLRGFQHFYAIFPFLEVHGHLGFAQHDAPPPAAGAEPPHSWKLEQTL